MDAMLLLSKTFCASWSIGLATALLAAVPSGHIATAENMVGGTSPAHSLDAAASEGAFRHLRALQDIASVSGGNRAAGTPGYDRSAEYVADRLKEAGYLVRFEEFEFPFFEERVPPVLLVSFPDGRQEPTPTDAFRTLTNSGSSNVTARLRAVNLGLAEGPPLASASSCKTTDFDEFERGFVALIRRGTCTFQTKVDNAWAAGAAAVVIMNEGTDGRTDAFSGQLRDLAPIPVVGVSYELGRSLDIAARGGATVRLDVNAMTGKRLTRNVLADTAFNSGCSARSGAAIGPGTDRSPRWRALRILGRRGARTHRLPAPSGIPARRGASAHCVVYQPRYGRLAQLRALRSGFHRER